MEGINFLDKMIGRINGDITRRIELKNNSKVYQILLKQFRNYEQNIEHMETQNREYERQIEDMQEKRRNLVDDLTKLRGRLVSSKNQCEKYLTEAMKREIRITGDINKLE